MWKIIDLDYTTVEQIDSMHITPQSLNVNLFLKVLYNKFMIDGYILIAGEKIMRRLVRN